MPIKNVIFDLGGVMIDWQPRRLYEKLFHSDHAIDFFLENVTTSDWNEQQDAGRPIAAANAELIGTYPEYAPEIEAFYRHWEAEMLGGAISGMIDILHYFVHSPRFHKVVALTNWSAETFPFAQEKFEFLQWFDGILVSGIEEIKKPDPRIYNLLLERFSLKAKESLFIDDSARNVKAAQALGIPSIQFTNKENLLAELSAYSIEIINNER
jgi:2-haloacid dehalogenase